MRSFRLRWHSFRLRWHSFRLRWHSFRLRWHSFRLRWHSFRLRRHRHVACDSEADFVDRFSKLVLLRGLRLSESQRRRTLSLLRVNSWDVQDIRRHIQNLFGTRQWLESSGTFCGATRQRCVCFTRTPTDVPYYFYFLQTFLTT